MLGNKMRSTIFHSFTYDRLDDYSEDRIIYEKLSQETKSGTFKII